MSDADSATMQILRSSTRAEHDRAEHHEFQRAMVKGEISRERYAAWLGQMYLIHDTLETALRESAAEHESVRSVVRDYQFQVPYLLEDLEFLDVDPSSVEALPATARFIARVAARSDDPIFLLGLHYVLEGSNNGSRYIARHVAAAFGLSPGPGLRYLDPYGDRQREYWQAFKDDVTAAQFSDSENDRLVGAAKQMYETVAELSTDLAATT